MRGSASSIMQRNNAWAVRGPPASVSALIPGHVSTGDGILVWCRTRGEWVRATVTEVIRGAEEERLVAEFHVPSLGLCRKRLPTCSKCVRAISAAPTAKASEEDSGDETECDPAVQDLRLPIFDSARAHRHADREDHIHQFQAEALRRAGRTAELEALEAADWHLGILDPRRQDDKTPFAVGCIAGFRMPPDAGSDSSDLTPKATASQSNLLRMSSDAYVPQTWFQLGDDRPPAIIPHVARALNLETVARPPVRRPQESAQAGSSRVTSARVAGAQGTVLRRHAAPLQQA